MGYSKKDVLDVATKLGRLVNGGVVGYYAGGKTSEVMSSTLPDEIVKVVESHKNIQLGASLAQSFIPGASFLASSAAVASLWKMYYDINGVLGIKISENVGKSLTSAIVTNLSSSAAQMGATFVSEGAKFVPGVGWLASAAISTVTTTAIIYGSAFLYLNALIKMYEAEGKFDINYLEASIEDDDIDEDNYEDETANEGGVSLTCSNVKIIKQAIADNLGLELEDITSTDNLEDDLNADDDDKQSIIDDLEVEFDISISKDASDFIFVDDFIECITGESIWDEDDKYDGEDDNLYEMDNETIERFNAFYKSYVNDEYKDMEVSKLASMFENEAENCKSDVIKSQYYCIAAVSRIEFYLKEWFDNSFESYPESEDVNELNRKCIIEGINDISKSRELLPEDKEYYLINSILDMLNDFFVECKDSKDDFVKKYGNVDEECKDFDDSMFNMDWVLGTFKKVYNAILMGFDINQSDKSTCSDSEQEYLEELKDILSDGEISPRERRLLDKIRVKLGISEERVQELEAPLTKPQLTEDEQEYLDMYREYAEKGEITEKERRRLDKFAAAMRISEERANEIEQLC